MNPFSYNRVTSSEAALHAGTAQGAKFLGGGTNLIDLMKSDVEQPTALVDINHIGLDTVVMTANGVRIGALVRNSDLANHPLITAHYPLLSHALLLLCGHGLPCLQQACSGKWMRGDLWIQQNSRDSWTNG